MRHALKLHPDSTCDAIKRIDVEFGRLGESALRLDYTASGTIANLLLLPPATSERTDELWRTTCFEAFFVLGDDYEYTEFNFAPSTAWASYRFTGHRQGMKPATDLADPRITVKATADQFQLSATLEFPHRLWDVDRVALTAVIEETNGRKSYWALEHPPGKPDFHHVAGFALDLANKRYE
jgi:hypothetical protein